MARESTPTLCHAIRFMESWMTAWEDHQEYLAADHQVHNWIEEGLYWAKKYYRRMDSSKAFAISMCACSNILCYPDAALTHRLQVLNPYMREAWMQTYWDEYYISKAKGDIMSEVSTHYCSRFGRKGNDILGQIVQMGRYRTRLVQEHREARGATTPARPQPTPPPALQPVRTLQHTGPKPALSYDNIECRWGLVKLMDLPRAGPSLAEDGFTQTVEEEYKAYCAIPRDVVDLYTGHELAFWDVRCMSAMAA